MAEQAFRLCVSSMEILLAEIVKSFPDQVRESITPHIVIPC